LLSPFRGLRRRSIASIVIFAFDLAEAAQQKRIAMLRAEGHAVRTISFRRRNMDAQTIDVPNLDLGDMPNQRFLLRLWLLARAIPKVVMARRFMGAPDLIIARNFDLLALAWIARRGQVPLIYECLDIHSLMTGDTAVNKIMRRVERFLMRRSQLLWTSSPGFLSQYFEKIQNHTGPSVIVENKLWFSPKPAVRPSIAERPDGDGPLVLGWVGSIRCQASFDILCETARALPQTLRIEVHGNIHHHAVANFDATVAALDNVTYHGPYRYPDGLAQVYGRCDIIWGQDLWQRGGNSDWLLPNRIYEASWHGCPTIAVADTETGRRVASQGLGPVLQSPNAENLVTCLKDLDRAKVRDLSRHILQMDDGLFQLTGHDIKAALAPVLEN
jgi:succinoglycan biosynthesis protein ExoL